MVTFCSIRCGRHLSALECPAPEGWRGGNALAGADLRQANRVTSSDLSFAPRFFAECRTEGWPDLKGDAREDEKVMLVQVRTETGNAIKIRSLDDHDRPPRRFANGRLCAESSCGTRLSIYNDSEYCSLHHQGVKPRIRGKKVR